MKPPRSLLLLAATTVGMYTAVATPAWEDFVAARSAGTEPLLPDFSYAGYHRSEVDLPSVDGPVFDVTDYGAIANDNRSDRDAIQAAIVAAENAGGGVVRFPAGRFHLNTLKDVGAPLRIRRSNIVLRGAGAWSDGTELFMEAPFAPEDPDALYSTPEILHIRPNSTGTTTKATVTAAAARESFTLEVSNGGAFAVGEWITLQLDDPAAVADYFAPKTVEPEWARLADDGLQARERHQVAAIDGNTLTLAEPLHLDIDPAYAWSVRTYPHLEEIGIEDIAFRGNWLGEFQHHRSALDDSAWSCLQIENVVNGWIQRCRFLNWNEVVNLHDSSFFTVLHTRIEGNPGHFGIHTRRGYGILVALGADHASQWHGPSVGYQSAGSVFWRYDHAADSSFDAHGSGPYATLLDAGSGGLLRGRTGGPLEGQPNHLRWFTLWNFEHTGVPFSNYDFWIDNATSRDRFLFPFVVGFHGTAGTFAEDDLGLAESIGTPVSPESLFEAQLALRLGSAPAFLQAWKTAWVDWEAQPVETVVHVGDADALDDAIAIAQPGTRIVFRNGIYRNQSLRLDGGDSPMGGGTAEWPITLCAEEAGKVIFTGRSDLRLGGIHMVAEGLFFTAGDRSSGEIIRFSTDSSNPAFDCVLRNCAIVDFNPENPATDYDWISVRGQRNRIEYCSLTGMNHKGVQLVVILDEDEIPNATVIRGNHFADRAEGDGNGYETIRIGTSDRSLLHADALVEGNLFERCDGEIEIISNKSVGNHYEGNTFRDSRGQLTLRHGADCVVDGNFFLGDYKTGSSGVRIIGPGHTVTNNYFAQLRGNSGVRAAITLMNGVPNSPLNRYEPLTDAYIAHNTIIDCDAPFIIGATSSEGDTTVAPADSIFANNVVSSAFGPHFDFVNEPVNFSYYGQVSHGAASGLPGNVTVATFDPLFTPDADGILRPGASSPLLDAADDSAASGIMIDLDGQPRPLIGRDLGADEVSSAPILRRPLTAEDVGTSWPIVIPEIAEPGTEGLKEDFNYTNDVLRGQGFWADSSVTASRESENTDAIFIDGGELHLDFDGSGTVGTVFSPIFNGDGRTSGDLFASFHFRLDTLYPGDSADYLAAFSSTDGNTLRGRIWITDTDIESGTFRLGVTSKTGSPFAVAKTEPLSVGRTYGLILQHSFNSSTTLTRLYLDASAVTDRSVEESSSSGSELNGFAFRSSAASLGSIVIEALRASDTFDAVLNPVRDPFGGVRLGNTLWYESPDLGRYYRLTSGYVYLPATGWMWFHSTGYQSAGVYMYDYTDANWWYVPLRYFPWVYIYNDNPGWYYIFPDSVAENRHIVRY